MAPRRASAADLKTALRREALARRDAIEPDLRASLASKATKRLLGLSVMRPGATVGFYAARGSEMPTDGLLADALRRGVRVALPRVDRATGALTFHAVADPAALRPGAFGIREPASTAPMPENLDAIVVPGVAFDPRGHRLGTGRGYFDRYLRDRPGLRIGLAFEAQIVEALPDEPHDEPMDLIVTEKRVLRTRA
ncbi:MAG TPA: 5-formyltetrahydrofolate cyclo-ligase [Candidatus Thermoplasmatota archaeon]|nr:5-formyltetrahydrofolate cyclo-ligase [Candidatus Thermoplasmatota archaeon]